MPTSLLTHSCTPPLFCKVRHHSDDINNTWGGISVTSMSNCGELRPGTWRSHEPAGEGYIHMADDSAKWWRAESGDCTNARIRKMNSNDVTKTRRECFPTLRSPAWMDTQSKTKKHGGVTWVPGKVRKVTWYSAKCVLMTWGGNETGEITRRPAAMAEYHPIWSKKHWLNLFWICMLKEFIHWRALEGANERRHIRDVFLGRNTQNVAGKGEGEPEGDSDF